MAIAFFVVEQVAVVFFVAVEQAAVVFFAAAVEQVVAVLFAVEQAVVVFFVAVEQVAAVVLLVAARYFFSFYAFYFDYLARFVLKQDEAERPAVRGLVEFSNYSNGLVYKVLYHNLLYYWPFLGHIHP